MPQAWLNDAGEVILNGDGSVMYDDTCCCTPQCPLCSVTPSAVTVEFLSDPSTVPSGWVGSWTLEADPKNPCCYLKTTDLPNTCYKMTACIVSSGYAPSGEGYYKLVVRSFYPNPSSGAHDDTCFEGFTGTIDIDPPATKNCLENGQGVTDSTGYGPGSGGAPVNWINTYLVSFHHQVNLSSEA